MSFGKMWWLLCLGSASSSNGQDGGFSSRKSEFDSPWGHHKQVLHRVLRGGGSVYVISLGN